MDPLRRCTGDREAFLDGTWGARAAVHPAAEPEGFPDLLTLDDVDRILTTTSLRTPSFRLVKAGEQIPESSYTRSGRTGSKPVSGMADPARIAELFDDGATIVLQGLHRNWEPVAAFTRALELQLGHPCQVNAYITPPGAQGLALHADPHDVFVLQAFGRKQWEVHAAPGEPERDPIDADLGPGDCIYMPTGTPHAATTGTHCPATSRSACTLSRGAMSWPTSGVRSRTIPRSMTRSRSAGRTTGAVRGPVAPTARRARPALKTSTPTRSPTADPAVPLDAGAVAPRRAGAGTGARCDRGRHLLTVRPGAVCELRRDGDRLTVLLGDRRLDMPGWLEPAMREVGSANRFAVRDLTPSIADPASRLVLARRLVREGLLLTDTAPLDG